MSLSADEVRKVADLARLELSEADVEIMARQLSAIVDYINQLQQVNTDGIEPLATPSNYTTSSATTCRHYR